MFGVDITPFLETYRGIWETEKLPGELWCEKYHVWDDFDFYYVLTFRDAIRRVINWKWNTWQMFEPGELQEATWNELSEPTWEDMESDMAGAEPFLTEEEWDGIRSRIYAIYDETSSSSSGGPLLVDGYLYWYNLLSEKYPYIEWPVFEPDLTKNSDADYWNVYDKIDITTIRQHINEPIRPLPINNNRITEDDENEITESGDNQVGEEATFIREDLDIFVIEYGDLISEELWYYPTVWKMTEDCSNFKLMEAGHPKKTEVGNEPEWNCPTPPIAPWSIWFPPTIVEEETP